MFPLCLFFEEFQLISDKKKNKDPQEMEFTPKFTRALSTFKLDLFGAKNGVSKQQKRGTPADWSEYTCGGASETQSG